MASKVDNEINLRAPRVTDGPKVYELIESCPPLDVNSRYAYLLLCSHFAETCIIGESGGQMGGFVSGYKIPERPDTLFIWQVAVHESARGKGLAGRMIMRLVQDHAQDIHFLESTVTPSNEASKALFRSLAKRLDAECSESTGYEATLFGARGGHEEERLFRIGPFDAGKLDI